MWWIIPAVIITLLAAWGYFTAQRLNRLHIRTDAALQNVHGAMDRRASLVQALVPQLSDLARRAQSTPFEQGQVEERTAIERELGEKLDIALATQKIRTQIDDMALAMLVDATARVDLATRFYNAAVTDTRALRTRPMIRTLRLGGTAKLPRYVELLHVAREKNGQGDNGGADNGEHQ